MPSIRYLGPTSEDIDVLNRLRLQTEISGTLTPAMIDQQITTSLAPKANNFYLGNEVSKYAPSSALGDKAATLIKRSEADRPNGPLSLSSSNSIAMEPFPTRYNRPGGRGWRKVGEWTAQNLNLATGEYNSTAEQQIGSFTVNGPNFGWLALFMGDFTIGGGKGEIMIKRGNINVSRAIGGNNRSQWFTCELSPAATDFGQSYVGSQTFTVHRKASFPGVPTNIAPLYDFICFAIPAVSG